MRLQSVAAFQLLGLVPEGVKSGKIERAKVEAAFPSHRLDRADPLPFDFGAIGGGHGFPGSTGCDPVPGVILARCVRRGYARGCVPERSEAWSALLNHGSAV